MRHEHYTVTEHGFVGHLAEPDAGSDRAVIVVMGGEKSFLPGIIFAERFADFGLSIYGQSMGSIFAALAAEKLGGFREAAARHTGGDGLSP